MKRNRKTVSDDPMSRWTPAVMQAAAAGDLANVVAASTPGGIEAQEAAGQRDAVRSQRLPKDGTQANSREGWERLGFVFHEDDDDIFVNVTFPPGWRLEATDHSMWSNLLDDKGRKRASMFYKAAFYDRSAHIRRSRRFNTDVYHQDGVVATDCGRVIKNFGKVDRRAWNEQDAKGEEARAWLTANYPDWENPDAYWD